MKYFHQLMLAILMFSFTITGISVYPSKAYAGAQDGKFHLKCPKPAKWMLPNGKCINKGTKKRAGIAAYWNSQDTGGTGASDIHAKAESYCRTNSKLISLKHGIQPFGRQQCEDTYIAGATEFAGR